MSAGINSGPTEGIPKLMNWMNENGVTAPALAEMVGRFWRGKPAAQWVRDVLVNKQKPNQIDGPRLEEITLGAVTPADWRTPLVGPMPPLNIPQARHGCRPGAPNAGRPRKQNSDSENRRHMAKVLSQLRKLYREHHRPHQDGDHGTHIETPAEDNAPQRRS